VALESVWTVALGKSDGLSRQQPALVFFVVLPLSMAGLACGSAWVRC
jgi:quaternary ammonium compound-resistance protein SugE